MRGKSRSPHLRARLPRSLQYGERWKIPGYLASTRTWLSAINFAAFLVHLNFDSFAVARLKVNGQAELPECRYRCGGEVLSSINDYNAARTLSLDSKWIISGPSTSRDDFPSFLACLMMPFDEEERRAGRILSFCMEMYIPNEKLRGAWGGVSIYDALFLFTKIPQSCRPTTGKKERDE